MPSQPPVDKSAPIPLYYQVACDLKSRIQQGEWKPNEKIPSEHQLTGKGRHPPKKAGEGDLPHRPAHPRLAAHEVHAHLLPAL